MNLIRNRISEELVPTEFSLGQNYPNPFNDKTTIKYCIAYETNVKLTVCDSKGQVIKILVDEDKKPGTYEVEFYVESFHKMSLENGIYTYRFVAGNFSSKKVMMIEK